MSRVNRKLPPSTDPLGETLHLLRLTGTLYCRSELTAHVARFDHVAAEHLIALLPRVLQIDTWDDDEGGWLQSTLRFIARAAGKRPPRRCALTARRGALTSPPAERPA